MLELLSITHILEQKIPFSVSITKRYAKWHVLQDFSRNLLRKIVFSFRVTLQILVSILRFLLTFEDILVVAKTIDLLTALQSKIPHVIRLFTGISIATSLKFISRTGWGNKMDLYQIGIRDQNIVVMGLSCHNRLQTRIHLNRHSILLARLAEGVVLPSLLG